MFLIPNYSRLGSIYPVRACGQRLSMIPYICFDIHGHTRSNLPANLPFAALVSSEWIKQLSEKRH